MLKILITPAIAADMLTRNTGNRKLRKGVAKLYAAQMTAGQWLETHEAIAVDSHGNLVDGQHRLEAIVISGCAQSMWLATYADGRTATDLPIDMGLRRTAADALQIDRRSANVVGVILRLVDNNRTARSMAAVRKAYDLCEPTLSKVIDASPGNVKQRTAATVRAAVLLRCLESPQAESEILTQYAAFVRMDWSPDMWLSVQNLLKQMDGETPRHLGRDLEVDRMCRAWKAFSMNGRNTKTLRIFAGDTSMQEMFDLCKRLGITK